MFQDEGSALAVKFSLFHIVCTIKPISRKEVMQEYLFFIFVRNSFFVVKKVIKKYTLNIITEYLYIVQLPFTT